MRKNYYYNNIKYLNQKKAPVSYLSAESDRLAFGKKNSES